jgi:hypothetical protein
MRFYDRLPVFFQAQPDFGGAPNASYIAEDMPRKVGGEVDGGTGRAGGICTLSGVICSFVRRDLLAELEELHERVVGVESKCVTEAVKLSRSIMEISDALVDLGVFPIRDIHEHPKSAQDVLTVVGLLLQHLREAHDKDTGSWVQNLACLAPL